MYIIVLSTFVTYEAVCVKFVAPIKGVRNASTLVVAEHNGESVTPITYNTLSAAKEIGGDITALLVGEDCSKVTSCFFCYFLHYWDCVCLKVDIFWHLLPY